jgi:hypothetical protein
MSANPTTEQYPSAIDIIAWYEREHPKYLDVLVLEIAVTGLRLRNFRDRAIANEAQGEIIRRYHPTRLQRVHGHYRSQVARFINEHGQGSVVMAFVNGDPYVFFSNPSDAMMYKMMYSG